VVVVREKSERYPWYDSVWLTRYALAKDLIQRIRPEKLAEFVQAFECLKTRPDFQIKHFCRVFDDAAMEQIKQAVRLLKREQLEMHEIQGFGRFVVHDHPFFTELQQSTVALVSDAAGEPVEASYNFLSMYTKLGVCPIHMDAPQAKWTLDVCVDQSERWPIYFSPIVPWPEHFASDRDDWHESIKAEHSFSSYSLEPGQGVMFSGSSQWHYRDALPETGDGKQFCTLLFFHFVPRGMRETVEPKNWARLFDIPELLSVVQ
jgi:hypothetical protein